MIPILVLAVTEDFKALAGLLRHRRGRRDRGQSRLVHVSTSELDLTWYQRLIMGVDVPRARRGGSDDRENETGRALLRHVRAGHRPRLARLLAQTLRVKTVTMTTEVAEMVAPDLPAAMQPRLEEGQKIMVAARGINPVLNFALEEAQLRKAVLCVVYVKEIVVYFSGGARRPGRAKWQDDPEANAIMSLMLKEGEERGVCVLPVYAVSEDAAATILDLSATMGVDYLVIGTSQRSALAICFAEAWQTISRRICQIRFVW